MPWEQSWNVAFDGMALPDRCFQDWDEEWDEPAEEEGIIPRAIRELF